MTPIELQHALIDESDDLITVDTPIKQAWRALSDEQRRQAGQQLYAEHKTNVDTYRADRNLPEVDWKRYMELACGK